MKIFQKIFGLGFKRVAEWRAVMREETRQMTWWQQVSLLLHMTKVLWNATPATKKKWRQRMRICARCPVFDREMHRCRPYSGSKVGCGCYTPLTAILEPQCWGRAHLPPGMIEGW